MICVHCPENISHVLQFFLLCLFSDEELNDEALELTRALECVHLHSDVGKFIISDRWMVDHDTQPFVLQ